MEAERRPLGAPLGGGAITARVERHHEAFIAAPGIAHAKECQAFEKGHEGRFGDGLEDDREEPRGAGVVAPPDVMAGITLERGIEHARNLGPCRKPLGHLEGRLPVALEANP